MRPGYPEVDGGCSDEGEQKQAVVTRLALRSDVLSMIVLDSAHELARVGAKVNVNER